jgi:Cd2+/Zn2+-exporting ATPase
MSEKIKLNFHGIHCAGCAGKIENEIKNLSDIVDANINFSAGTISVEYNNGISSKIIDTLNTILNRNEPGSYVEVPKVGGESNSLLSNINKGKLGLFLLSVATLISAVLIDNSDISLPLFGVAYISAGFSVLKKAVSNLSKGMIFDENFLMSIATIGAIFLGEYPEAVAVMLFYKAGEVFQSAAVQKSREQIKSLTNLRPDKLRVVMGMLYNETIPEKGRVGDIFEVRAGERIALDGEIVDGEGKIDTSSLTGESLERSVSVGDSVLSGMVNVNAVLKIKVTKTYENSTVKKILDIIENSTEKKSGTENLLTKFSAYYTPIVVGLAVVMSSAIPFIFDQSYSEWLYRGLLFLVISCPCALVLSIPLTYFGSVGRAAKEGILVKGSGFLDEVNRVSTAAFDKTGTLTKGELKIDRVKSDGRGDLYDIIYSLESFSNHPLATVLKREAESNGGSKLDVEGFEEIRGRGVKGSIKGKQYYIGSHNYINQLNIPMEGYEGYQVLIADSSGVFGAINLKDSLKDGAFNAIESCHKGGVSTAIISGDLNHIVEDIRSELKIDKAYSEKLPEEKIDAIKELQKRGKVIYFGDGINDAPVMTEADLAVSMGSLGSDAAVEASDIVFMNDDISLTKQLFGVAALNKKLIVQNITFILLAKISIMGLGAMGLSSLWQAVFADVGVAFVAVLNSLRILRAKI